VGGGGFGGAAARQPPLVCALGRIYPLRTQNMNTFATSCINKNMHALGLMYLWLCSGEKNRWRLRTVMIKLKLIDCGYKQEANVWRKSTVDVLLTDRAHDWPDSVLKIASNKKGCGLSVTASWCLYRRSLLRNEVGLINSCCMLVCLAKRIDLIHIIYVHIHVAQLLCSGLAALLLKGPFQSSVCILVFLIQTRLTVCYLFIHCSVCLQK
jgi:hypothetical protein